MQIVNKFFAFQKANFSKFEGSHISSAPYFRLLVLCLSAGFLKTFERNFKEKQ